MSNLRLFVFFLFFYQWHSPNIDGLGRHCLDVLDEKWSPALRVESVCRILQSLLANPNPHDPVVIGPVSGVCTMVFAIAIVLHMSFVR